MCIKSESLEHWKQNKEWPEGIPEQRETLISGLCPECQKEVLHVG